MKVLWIVNDPLPDFALYLGTRPKTGGGWLPALSQALAQEGTVELGVASRVPGGKVVDFPLKGIHHFSVPAPIKGYSLLRPTANMLRRYQEIIDLFSPDVIHVHGTEWYGGIVTICNRLQRPTVVSIQGLIGCSRRYLLGDLSFLDILKSRTLQEWFLFSGLWKQSDQWKKRALIENEIIQGHHLFIGRTLWDRAHLRQMNPQADYFHCDEMACNIFFNNIWSLSEVKRHSIFAPSADYPLKGFHVVVKAVAILKSEFPDIQVRVPLSGFAYPPGLRGFYSQIRNGGYANYLYKLINDLHVRDHIIPLGMLSAKQMAAEMQKANVFVLPSFVENGSMSRTEASIIGVPSIVSFVGGVPSMIDDERNVLGFPSGDEAVLAEQIRRIFLDDNLALQLSSSGFKTARKRHSPNRITQRMVSIYQAIYHSENPYYLSVP